tara:strand:- start:607 stop:1914 length:1308 start_codon:yes stop_codon:yes gene_type:complete
MNITIIGTGYVGLVTGACFADLGNHVRCIDIDKKKLRSIKNLSLPFYEPGLKEIISRNIKESRIQFTHSYSDISASDLIFLCIDTPQGRNGRSDLTNLNSCIDLIVKNLNQSMVIVTKSTVPIGTNAKLLNRLNRDLKKKRVKVSMCANPEFLKEGSAVNDFLRPDRIILGSEDQTVLDLLKALYKPLNRKSNKIIEMTIESAELTKYASNAFLASKISFMNNMAHLAEEVGANIHEIRHGMGADPRIGKDFLYAGIGYGGSCFPKDIKSLIETEKSFDIDTSFLSAVEKINKDQIRFFVKKLIQVFKKNIGKKNLLIWGLSFKPNTDDIRDSVAIEVISELAKKVEKIYIYDPLVKRLPKKLQSFKNIFINNKQYSNINSSHALVILTEWKQFWDPDLKKLAGLKDKQIFDGRNILDSKSLRDMGFNYHGVGIN